eukprot:1374752-Rhodomonas_salina.1
MVSVRHLNHVLVGQDAPKNVLQGRVITSDDEHFNQRVETLTVERADDLSKPLLLPLTKLRS